MEGGGIFMHVFCKLLTKNTLENEGLIPFHHWPLSRLNHRADSIAEKPSNMVTERADMDQWI